MWLFIFIKNKKKKLMCPIRSDKKRCLASRDTCTRWSKNMYLSTQMVRRQGSTMTNFALDIGQVKGWQLAPIYRLSRQVSRSCIHITRCRSWHVGQPNRVRENLKFSVASAGRHLFSRMRRSSVAPIRGKYWYRRRKDASCHPGGRAYARFDESR